MNMQEFAALKEGDAIENHASQSKGVVTEASTRGVRVRWGDGRPGNSLTFFYSVQGTAWFHWTKAEETRLDKEGFAD